MRKLIIEKAAVRANMAVIKERARGAALYGVLTGDGGGAGLTELARLIRDEGISRFAVGTVEEAQALREAGFEDEELLMLRATVDREELERLVDLNVVCTISSVDTGLALNAVAENRSTVAEAHIQVDTGMGFGGFLIGEPEKILLAYRSLPNVALSGIYTQLHAVSPKGPELDAVRAGSVLLGRCRRSQGDGLRPVGFGEAPLAEVRWLPKGHTVGADRLTALKRPTRVAVLPVGYQNGFGVDRPRDSGLPALWRQWKKNRNRTVRLGEQRVKIIGSIGATETILNVTDVKCSAGDPAVFELDPLYARGFQIEYR